MQKLLKKQSILILGALALTTSFAFAENEGGSVGGGTNISLKEGKLTDFVKFDENYGKDAKVINPRKVKLPKTNDRIYDGIKPAIEHVEYLYPGMGVAMEGALDMPWLVVGKNFPSRSQDEKKVIVQNRDAIYLDRDWVKTASPAKIQEAFVHELVRRLAFKLLTRDKQDSDIKNYVADPAEQKREDELTELLTPAIFKKLPQGVFDDLMRKANVILEESENAHRYFRRNVKVQSRKDIYATLNQINARTLIDTVCANLNDKNATYDLVRAYKFNISSLAIGDMDADLVPSADAREILTFFRRYARTSNSPERRDAALDSCKKIQENAFYQEYVRDQGKVKNSSQGSEDLSDDDSAENESSETPAK